MITRKLFNNRSASLEGRFTAQTLCYIVLALLAFSANSILCRLGLNQGGMSATVFSILRVLSGTLILLAIAVLTKRLKFILPLIKAPKNWLSCLCLTVYIFFFSEAYLSIDAGSGAIIIFGIVQIVMFIAGLLNGERLRSIQWLGFSVSLLGLVYLVFPKISTPSFLGVIYMSLAGLGWGLYTLMGKYSKNAIDQTICNFVLATPITLAIGLVYFFNWNSEALEQVKEFDYVSVVCAVVSGAITSACGYSIWYIAMQSLSKIQASVLQLATPILTAIGGFIFLGEALTLRLVVASIFILGGIYIVVAISNKSKD